MLTIRTASPADAEAIGAIYAPYVEKTAITFEYQAPGGAEMARRIEATLRTHPYLVAEEKGSILGYAYASPFYGRTAYQWSSEVSIYLSPAAQGRGIGRVLYERLEEILRKMGVRNLYACVAVPEGKGDEYLTDNSQRFHARMGYRTIGRFTHCGQKFGRWYSMVWMEKHIGDHPENAPPVVPFPALER